MNIRKPLLIAVTALAAVVARAPADYVIGEFQECLSAATHVVDANVTEITKDRHARLDVLRHIKGANAPVLLTRTALSCTHEPPGAFGMEGGRRYIIMLRDDALFEEGTYFEVTKNVDGTLGCRIPDFRKKWLGVSDNWISLEDMTALMTARDGK